MINDKNDSYFSLYTNKKLKILFFVLFSFVTLLLLYIYRYYFWPFLFAVILYIALRPTYEFVLKYLKKRVLSSAIIVISLFMLVLIPLFFLLLALADQTYEFYIFLQQNINPSIIEDFLLRNEIGKIFISYFNFKQGEIFQQILEVLQKTTFQIFSNLTTILTFSFHFSVNLSFMLLILFFLFKDGYKFDESFYKILPFPNDIEKDIVRRLKQAIEVLLAGNVIIMVLQGFAVGICFFIFGVGTPLLWGSIAAIFSLIPIVGTSFVWIPAVIYLCTQGNYLNGTLVGIWCLLWYVTLENLVKPNIFGKKLNFHPLLFFFLLLGSIQTFNLPGVIIGPILLTLFYSFWEIYKVLDNYEKKLILK